MTDEQYRDSGIGDCDGRQNVTRQTESSRAAAGRYPRFPETPAGETGAEPPFGRIERVELRRSLRQDRQPLRYRCATGVMQHLERDRLRSSPHRGDHGSVRNPKRQANG
jgi:hypothetical protein